jgi:hypothetical protein
MGDLVTEETKPKLWTPDDDKSSTLIPTVGDIVNTYCRFLEVSHPDHYKHFKIRLVNDQDAARAEAVVFSWLRANGYKPQIAESTSKGGVDFICYPESAKRFLVEVTTLNRKAVERRSGWPDELDETARAFSMIIPNLWLKVDSKDQQLERQHGPGILAICLTHVGASVLLGTLAAEWLMISEPQICVPLASERPLPSYTITDLRNAAFFKIKENGAIALDHQSISAILLIAICDNELEVIGMLNPGSYAPFDYHTIRKVPFLRVEWPIMDYIPRTEWVISCPSPSRFYHCRVNMTNAEWRGR